MPAARFRDSLLDWLAFRRLAQHSRGGRTRMRRGLWWVALAVVAVVAAGCGSKVAQEPPPGTGAKAEVKIVGKENVYEPATVEIKAGQEYEFVFANKGTSVHNLIVQAKDKVGQDFQTDVVVNADEESKFKVKIDKEGTYVMQCTYHPEMKGELKVTK